MNQAILVEGDRVKETGPAATVAAHAAAGARVIDLGAATVLPGLIDCHTHITSDPGDYYEHLFRRSPIDEAVVAHVYARRTLEAGFTTVRNVGADEFVDVALRNAIDRGDVAGPRMQVSTMPLSATGGHGVTAAGWVGMRGVVPARRDLEVHGLLLLDAPMSLGVRRRRHG